MVRAALLGIVLLAAGTAFGGPPAGSTGRLVLTSQTEGAEVFVDGELVGKLPLEKPVVLKPGKYTLKITKKGFTEFIDVFTIKARRDTKLDIDLLPFAGVVRITTNVPGSRVFVDGKFVGETPLDAELQPGARTLKLQKGGYRDLTKTLEVVAGQTQNQDLTLEELPLGENPFRPLPPRPPKWYEKWWVWAVLAGGTTVLALTIALPSYYLGRDPVEAFNPQFCWGPGCH